jgi:hypothetical protein
MQPMSLIAGALTLSALCLSCAASAQQPSVSRQIFLAADLNKDGFVDLDEFHKDIVRSFHALDHNRDGYISDDEIKSIPDQPRVALLLRAMKRADKDGDGRVSFREAVEARMAHFDAADTDKNSRLSMAEAIAFDYEAARSARDAALNATKTR